MKKPLLTALLLLVPASAAMAQETPLYRLYMGNDHLYTTSCREVRQTMQLGYTLEGVEGSLWRSPAPGLTPLYRAFGPRIKDHYYTTNPDSLNHFLSFGDRTAEGTTGFVSAQPAPGLVPLFAVTLPSHAHFYTSDPHEHGRVLRQGAQDEGVIGFLSANAFDKCHVLPNNPRPFRDGPGGPGGGPYGPPPRPR